MDSINRNRANARIGYVYDTNAASQGDQKVVKAHVKELSKMTGEVPMDDTKAFLKDFGGGV